MQETQEKRVQSLSWEDSPRVRKQQPTPVLLPGESQGQRGLVGYRPWGLKESDTTKRLSTQAHTYMHSRSEPCLAQTKCFLRRLALAIVMGEVATAPSKKIARGAHTPFADKYTSGQHAGNSFWNTFCGADCPLGDSQGTALGDDPSQPSPQDPASLRVGSHERVAIQGPSVLSSYAPWGPSCGQAAATMSLSPQRGIAKEIEFLPFRGRFDLRKSSCHYLRHSPSWSPD